MSSAIAEDDEEVRIAIARHEARAGWGIVIVVVGLVLKVVLVANFPNAKAWAADWGPLVADGLVAIGVACEVLFTRLARSRAESLQRASDEKVAELMEQVAKADLDRLQLEVQLQPRVLTKEQFDLVQKLRGRLETISIAYETDAETWWYANSLTQAFFSAGIKVFQYRRSPDVHSFGMLIYDPLMIGSHLSPRGEILVSLFRGTGAALAMVEELPADVPASPDIPAIFVGGRFMLPPPYMRPLESPVKPVALSYAGTRNAEINR